MSNRPCVKIRHPDTLAAGRHIARVEKYNAARGRVRPGLHLAVFFCPACAGYHVRHEPILQLRNPDHE